MGWNSSTSTRLQQMEMEPSSWRWFKSNFTDTLVGKLQPILSQTKHLQSVLNTGVSDKLVLDHDDTGANIQYPHLQSLWYVDSGTTTMTNKTLTPNNECGFNFWKWK